MLYQISEGVIVPFLMFSELLVSDIHKSQFSSKVDKFQIFTDMSLVEKIWKYV